MCKRKITKASVLLTVMSLLIALTGCSNTGKEGGNLAVEPTLEDEVLETEYDFTVDYEGIARFDNDMAKAEVHDPSIVKDGDTYYLFGSHLSSATSKDLTNWKMLSGGYTDKNPVFGDLKNMKSGEFDFTGYSLSTIPTEDKTVHVWAPDVIYNRKMGKYCMYGCTSSTFNASTIYMAVADTIEGPYSYVSTLLYSGETADNIELTNILDFTDKETAVSTYTSNAGFAYNYKKFPNCIDPTVFYDEDERLWMVYGSWSGGIFLIELDEESGMPIHADSDDKNTDIYYGKRLLGGGHHSIEGPYILYDKESGYYYLYVSYGELTREGGYQIRVFRSETVDGDYVDMNGAYPDAKTAHEYFGLKLSGNYFLPSLNVGYKATGHNSAFIDEDGRRYIAYHTRFDKASEKHTPKVKQYLLNKEGWPCMLPYVTSKEVVSDTGYDKDDIVGRYFFINQGTGIDNKVAAPSILYLLSDGSVKGEEASGTWSCEEGKYYMTLSFDEKEYSGVFCQMQDEAGISVMTFSAVGHNESVWGVKY
ncbi:MAG: glycoside hydrolase family 43 protein [Lachnospiraceae bacterium]|nr:glycoside hydrolase family 43 protein [Lachnospiraceae bacterium]